MSLDNREFITRHHKTEYKVPATKRRSPLASYGIAAAGLVVFISALYYISISDDMTIEVRLALATGLTLLSALSVLTFSIYQMYSRKSDRINLIYEVMEGSRGARLITDGADNTVYTNQKFNDLCDGLGPASLESLAKLFENSNEAASHFKLLADQAHRGLTDSIELFSKYEDKERWLMLTVQPVSGYAGYIHWRVDDVTQQYTLDRAIREEREKLIDFTDNAPVGFFSVDENGRFIFANATLARWLGEDLRHLLEKGELHTYLLEPPENANPYDLVEDSRLRQVVELPMKGAAGKTFLASINQVVVKENDGRVRTRAVVHDLTAEKEIKQALKASEDRFQRFFEEAPLGIAMVNKLGEIADCNHEFAVMLGTDISKIEGVSFETLIRQEDRPNVISAINRIEQGKQMQAPLEVTFTKGEETIQTQMHARRFRDGGDVVLHFINVSEQKSLEAQFVQSQKMQAIGQLAGGVAHDFNNLLTAIIGFCDLLLLRHKPGDPSFSDIMQIKQNSNRAANLVRQLLAFSRQQTLRPKVQDITDIITEVSHLLRRLIGAGIDLNLIHGQDLGLVKVDGGQMEQVLINMAVNARDAMDNTGQLTVETESFSNKDPLELVSEELPPGHWILIKITDTGHGIDPANLSRVFEPFFTTKDVGHGTGLGLSTVYGIVRQTDGYLDVKSEVGKGTTFFIYLPCIKEFDPDEEWPEEQAEPEDTKDLTGTERILLVEDEAAVRTFSQRALGNKGYEVLTAESGEDALSLMGDEENKYIDLLITDVVMPNMDGPTLAHRMRQDNKDLKIIFISGYTEEKLKDYMNENVWFLPKPFTLKQLAAKVKEVLED